jgi:stage II sporulation protein D
VGGRILKSTNFAIEAQPDYFVFGNGKGFGHGVGLCQNGMETKARRGMSYDRILSFYYPASKLKTLYR